MTKELPIPTGDYVAGVCHRSYTYHNAQEGDREISVTAFYPADTSAGKPSYPYSFPEANGADVSGIITHCYQDAPVSARQKSYPVVIFNCGYGCHEMYNTVLCCELASHGYAVFSMGIPFERTAVKYPDGRIILMREDYAHNASGEGLNDRLLPILEQMLATDEADDRTLVALGAQFFGLQEVFNERVDCGVCDIMACANWLEAANQSDALMAGRLDLARGIALAGHSYGGSLSMAACRCDSRFVCGINIDGGDFGYHYGEDIGKPFMIIGNPHMWHMMRAVYRANSRDMFFVRVNDAGHMDFTDFGYITDLRMEARMTGSRNREQTQRLLGEYHLMFLSRYLMGGGAPMRDAGYANTDYHSRVAHYD